MSNDHISRITVYPECFKQRGGKPGQPIAKVVYTDGSKVIVKGKVLVGGAIAEVSEKKGIKTIIFRINTDDTCIAEAWTILTWFEEYDLDDGHVLIATDSQTFIDRLVECVNNVEKHYDSKISQELQKIVNNICCCINSRNAPVTFVHVKSHTDIYMNNFVDKLAKKSTYLKENDVEIEYVKLFGINVNTAIPK